MVHLIKSILKKDLHHFNIFMHFWASILWAFSKSFGQFRRMHLDNFANLLEKKIINLFTIMLQWPLMGQQVPLQTTLSRAGQETRIWSYINHFICLYLQLNRFQLKKLSICSQPIAGLSPAEDQPSNSMVKLAAHDLDVASLTSGQRVKGNQLEQILE